MQSDYEFERLGSSKTRKVTVRIISATNADLKEEIEKGTFREDLYYRLNVIEINIVPLCDRKDDILPLALHFMPDDFVLTRDAERDLMNHSWPGNVRELQNVIQRASLLSNDKKLSADKLGLLPVKIASNSSSRIEPDKQMLIETLTKNKHNISQTAKQLGLSRQSLYRRLDKYDIAKGHL